MLNFFLKAFIKNYKNTADPIVRQRYGVFSGFLGIICNLLLFILKMTVGLIINSVAVISDAFNNFSDMGSTVVSVIGIKLSNKKPDRDHPFGHGRFEYVSALIVSFIIMLVGFELCKSSVQKIFNPTVPETVNWLLTAILALSIPVKLFMFVMNRHLGKAINSQTLLATAQDSLNDCIATGAVIIATVIDSLKLLPFTVDGYVGALVSLMIIYAGFSVAKNTVDLLLGKAPDEKTVEEIKRLLSEAPEIIDTHDLIVHDYGPGRLFASVHAEVKDDADFIMAHEIIDATEKHILHVTGCELTIHMDPVSTDNETLNRIRDAVYLVFENECCPWSIHDLRMTDGESNINIIFDMVVSYEATNEDIRRMTDLIKTQIKNIDERFSVVIQIDRAFVT